MLTLMLLVNMALLDGYAVFDKKVLVQFFGDGDAFGRYLDSRSPLMDAALWKEDFTYMKFGRSYTLRMPRRFVVGT